MKITEIDRRGFLRGLGAAGTTAVTGTAFAKKPVPKTNYYTIIVGKGDTIFSLARNLKLTTEELHELYKINGVDNKTRLEVGQTLKIPEIGVVSTSTSPPQQVEPATVSSHAELPKSIKPVAPHAASKNALEEPDFLKKLVQVAQELGVSAKALFGIIKHESHFKHHLPNPDTNAVGLIQFMPNIATELGTSTHQLGKMSGTEQLDYVYKYLKPKVKPGMSIGDMYMAVFMPAYVNAPNDTVLGKKGGGELGHTRLSMHKIWKQNPPFSNGLKKPYFTVGDVKKRLSTFLPS